MNTKLTRTFLVSLTCAALVVGGAFAGVLTYGYRQPEYITMPADPSSSAPVLINSSHILDPGYVPPDLESIYGRGGRAFSLSTADLELSSYVLDAAIEMFAAARDDGVTGYIITSAYRSYERQSELYAKDPYSRKVAPPGASEHQSGLAIDIWSDDYPNDFAATVHWEWIRANCARFGFIVRYPEDKTHITGIVFEPWYLRYVGREAAREIMSRGICLEEYIHPS